MAWRSTRWRLRVPTTPICPPTKKAYSNLPKYIAGSSVLSASALWWLTPTSKDAPYISPPAAEYPDNKPGPSKEQVTQIISKQAYSYAVKNVPGIDRYDGAQVASNSPCEDWYTHGKFASPWNDGNDWVAWGVFDGHSGPQTGEVLKAQLVPFVQRNLGKIPVPSSGNGKAISIPEETIQRAIAQAFSDLDDSIMNTALAAIQSKEPLSEKVKKCFPAFAGSCALLSLYDPTTSSLHVACTGDSRAVLGHQTPDGSWKATALSIDQTGYNTTEYTRLHNEHPGEKDMIKGGRVLGLAVSRAFGDSRWKWALDVQRDMAQRFYGPGPLTPRYDVRTPPYLTAEPVVTSTKIDPSRPSFLIMATDGMWDMLSSQQAVDLVGRWMEAQQVSSSGNRKGLNNPEPFDFSGFQDGSWRFVDERTTVQDDNAAVHLVRNSFGGNHHELIAGRLAFTFPHSRRARDDITVQVVFFNAQIGKD
ncbi:phosphatase 2C-like domain-containing protein [Aspergillus californicus]